LSDVSVLAQFVTLASMTRRAPPGFRIAAVDHAGTVGDRRVGDARDEEQGGRRDGGNGNGFPYETNVMHLSPPSIGPLRPGRNMNRLAQRRKT
jgi:hypothetical protein